MKQQFFNIVDNDFVSSFSFGDNHAGLGGTFINLTGGTLYMYDSINIKACKIDHVELTFHCLAGKLIGVPLICGFEEMLQLPVLTPVVNVYIGLSPAISNIRKENLKNKYQIINDHFPTEIYSEKTDYLFDSVNENDYLYVLIYISYNYGSGAYGPADFHLSDNSNQLFNNITSGNTYEYSSIFTLNLKGSFI